MTLSQSHPTRANPRGRQIPPVRLRERRILLFQPIQQVERHGDLRRMFVSHRQACRAQPVLRAPEQDGPEPQSAVQPARTDAQSILRPEISNLERFGSTTKLRETPSRTAVGDSKKSGPSFPMSGDSFVRSWLRHALSLHCNSPTLRRMRRTFFGDMERRLDTRRTFLSSRCQTFGITISANSSVTC